MCDRLYNLNFLSKRGLVCHSTRSFQNLEMALRHASAQVLSCVTNQSVSWFRFPFKTAKDLDSW